MGIENCFALSMRQAGWLAAGGGFGFGGPVCGGGFGPACFFVLNKGILPLDPTQGTGVPWGTLPVGGGCAADGRLLDSGIFHG
jgi:hypothetical protein